MGFIGTFYGFLGRFMVSATQMGGSPSHIPAHTSFAVAASFRT